MSFETRLRLVTSLGLGAIFAAGGVIAAYLMVQAAELFTWPVIIMVFAGASIGALVLDLVTTPRQQ